MGIKDLACIYTHVHLMHGLDFHIVKLPCVSTYRDACGKILFLLLLLPFWYIYKKLQNWLKRWPEKADVLKMAGQGSWFELVLSISGGWALQGVVISIAIFNYAVVVTDMKFGPYICGSIAGMAPESFTYIYSGRLIRTLADVKYGKHHMTTVEIVANVISSITAIVTIVAFTVYAKRTLNNLRSMRANEVRFLMLMNARRFKHLSQFTGGKGGCIMWLPSDVAALFFN